MPVQKSMFAHGCILAYIVMRRQRRQLVCLHMRTYPNMHSSMYICNFTRVHAKISRPANAGAKLTFALVRLAVLPPWGFPRRGDFRDVSAHVYTQNDFHARCLSESWQAARRSMSSLCSSLLQGNLLDEMPCLTQFACCVLACVGHFLDSVPHRAWLAAVVQPANPNYGCARTASAWAFARPPL